MNTSTQDNLLVESKNLLKSRKSGIDNVFTFGIFDSQKSLEFKQTYMENEEFLSRYCYGGGKRRRNDSDVEYNPEDAKKLNKKKRKRKQNRKTNCKRGKAVIAASNSKTNPRKNPNRD